jgi:microcin C transport system substrate-binding protein
VVPVVGTFNSFTPWIQKGINPSGYDFVGAWMFLFDRLLERGDDEAATQYARLAESIAHADDYSWFKVRIDPRARWHDGVPITPADLIFTNNFIRKDATAAIRNAFRHFGDAEQTGPLEVTFHIIDPAFRNPSAGLSIGHLPILPAHYWKDRDITVTSQEPPLGSGPYKVAAFEPGKRIVYERVDNYWGRQVPSMRGKHNYRRIIFEYFRDETVAREAAKKGILSFRGEAVAKDWMTAYTDLPAVKDGYLIREIAEQRNISAMASAIVLNTRRERFNDRLVRKALTYAYDFEWINRVLNYGFYLRVNSYFDNSDLESSSVPEGRELALLEPFRDILPPELFTDPFVLPKSDGIGMNRDNMLIAERLLSEAGWNVVNGQLVNAYGEPFQFEMLTRNSSEERGALPYIAALKRLGIDARIRTADSAQYRNRVTNFQFDAAVRGYWATPTLGTYLKPFFHSSGAMDLYTENWAGIRNPAADAMIELALKTYDRDELFAAGRALDRVLLQGHYLIPTQVEPGGRWTYWNRFGRPKQSAKNRYYSFPETWWVDPAKSAAVDNYLKTAGGNEGE